MFINYETFKSILQKNADDVIQYAVYGSWRGKTVRDFFIAFFIANFLFFLFYRYIVVRYTLLLLTYFVLYFILGNRRMGLGLGKKGFTFVKLRLLSLNPKEVDDIPYECIKYIHFTHFLFNCNAQISFISDQGKLKRIRISFSPIVIGLGSSKQRESFTAILQRLKEYQKELDRGDF